MSIEGMSGGPGGRQCKCYTVTIPQSLSCSLAGCLQPPPPTHSPSEDSGTPGSNMGPSSKLARYMPVCGQQPTQVGWYLSFLWGN